MKIRHISSEDTNKLADFFNGISTDETIKNFFHPHPFTKEYAEKICSKKGIKEDLYFVAKGNNEIIGYAMLRGWDEGYDIPSFGICVHPRHQRKGIGKKLTHHAIDL